ncbi:MAG TPA: hypothetical protein VGA49_00665 [Patescibacteria group bacterium]
MKYKNLLKAIFALTIFFGAAGVVQAVSLGISPSRVVVDHLLRGSHYEKTIVLSRSDASQALNFQVDFEGEAADWVSTNYGRSFTIPTEVQRFPVNVMVDVPADTANGTYEGRLVFKGAPTETTRPEGQNVVSFNVNAILNLELTVVGDQVLDYQVSTVKVPNIEEGTPISVYLVVQNNGNVAARPTRLQVDFYDKFQKVLLDSVSVTEMNSVEAFRTGNVIADINTNLGVGQYWAFIKVYRDGQVIMETKVPFDILEIGSLEKRGEFRELLFKRQVNVGEVQKFTGIFENLGATPVFAKLVLEISRGDQLVDVVEGDRIRVERGKTGNTVAYYTPSTAGVYSVRAHINYDNKTTDVKDAQMVVRGIVTSMIVTAIETQGLLILVILLLIIIAVALHYSKKRKK